MYFAWSSKRWKLSSKRLVIRNFPSQWNRIISATCTFFASPVTMFWTSCGEIKDNSSSTLYLTSQSLVRWSLLHLFWPASRWCLRPVLWLNFPSEKSDGPSISTGDRIFKSERETQNTRSKWDLAKGPVVSFELQHTKDNVRRNAPLVQIDCIILIQYHTQVGIVHFVTQETKGLGWLPEALAYKRTSWSLYWNVAYLPTDSQDWQ